MFEATLRTGSNIIGVISNPPCRHSEPQAFIRSTLITAENGLNAREKMSNMLSSKSL
jgi:hypothetical protein